MFRRACDKEWANSLVWRDRVESFPPRLSEGNICVLANEPCLFRDGANRLPAAVRGDSRSVTVQGKSEIEMQGPGKRAGNPYIESSCRDREGPASNGLITLPHARPASSVLPRITHLPCAFQGGNFLQFRKTEN